ncbi:MAG: hypothetical protein JWM05_529 [Acidimicrobiales bacterium]|nr:hypothetical protein [Acidimicrobiales bacterium]
MHRPSTGKIWRVGVAGLALTVGGLGWGLSSASGGPGGPNTASGPAPKRVTNLAAGMPPTAQMIWAVVNGDGTLARSFPVAPVTTSAHLGTGFYEVDFYEDVTGCAYTATVGNPGSGTAFQGTIDVAARAGQARGVFIETKDLAGSFADRPFHLQVTC